MGSEMCIRDRDDTMLGALKVYARAGQGTIISPFILAGAMSPVSVAGTLTQILAEAMSGIAFAQALNPGSPVIFGSFASSISMQTGRQPLAHLNRPRFCMAAQNLPGGLVCHSGQVGL